MKFWQEALRLAGAQLTQEPPLEYNIQWMKTQNALSNVFKGYAVQKAE